MVEKIGTRHEARGNKLMPNAYCLTPEIKFGTDGWRGIIGDDFTFENVKIVAQALADYLIQARGSPRTKLGAGQARDEASVVVGYDTRFLSDKFAEVFVRVLLANGIKAKLTASIISTPLLSFTTKNYGFSWGVMFSASHNPAKYNGIKFRASYGGPASVEVTKKIESYLGLVLKARPEGKNTPRFNEKVTVEKIDPFKDYFTYLHHRINFSLLKKLKARIVVDPLYGCASGYLEKLLDYGTLRLKTIHNYRDPLFGGLQPEQVEHNLGELKKVVKKEKAFLGLAFDGDADRLGVVTDKGQYLTPHQVFPLLLDYLVREKGLTGKVVQTVSLGYLSKRIAQRYNLPFEEVPVGFKYICEKMLEEDILLGGEESGGYGFGKLTTLSQSKGGFTQPLHTRAGFTPLSDARRRAGLKGWLPERDGILSALLFLEMLAWTKKKPSELLARLEKNFGNSCFLREDLRLTHPDVTSGQNLKLEIKKSIFKSSNFKVSKILTIDGIKVIFSDDSWLLLRPSGTEPLFRLYAETSSIKKTKKLLAFAKKIVYNVAQNPEKNH